MEFALVLPVVLYLFVAIVDFARIFRHDLLLTNAARTGALYGSDSRISDQSPWADETEAALAAGYGLNPPPQINVRTGMDLSGNNYVEVAATADFYSITKFPGLPTKVPITRTIRMQKADHSVNGT